MYDPGSGDVEKVVTVRGHRVSRGDRQVGWRKPPCGVSTLA